MPILKVEDFDGDDFDQYATVQNGGVLQAGRTGANGWQSSGSSGNLCTWAIPVAEQTGRVRVAMAILTNDTSALNVFNIRSDAGLTDQISVGISALGALVVKRGTGNGGVVIAQSDTDLVALDNVTWTHIEVEVLKSDTVGTVKGYVNGAEVINETGLDTAQSASQYDAVTIVGNFTTCRYDDIVIGNDTTQYGDIAVNRLFPNGNGNYSEWTGSDSNQVDNYALVDENPISEADYVESQTVGDRDTYAFEDNGIAGDIVGVELRLQAKKLDSGTRILRAMHRRSTTDSEGADIALSTSTDVYSYLWEQDPAAGPGAWTDANFDASEFGVKIQS